MNIEIKTFEELREHCFKERFPCVNCVIKKYNLKAGKLCLNNVVSDKVLKNILRHNRKEKLEKLLS